MSIILILLLSLFLDLMKSNVLVIKFHRLMSIIKEQNYSLNLEYVNQRIDNPYKSVIKMGDPSQFIPAFLRTDEYKFYLSNYNCPQYIFYWRKMSKDFYYITPEEYFDNNEINEFHVKDSFFFEEFNSSSYNEIKVFNYSLIIDNNMAGPQCFHIGSQVLLKPDEIGNNLIDVLFKGNYTKSSFFEYKIINDDEMHLIMGLGLIEENRNKYRFFEPITISEGEFLHHQKWGLTFENINIKDYNNSYNRILNAEFDISIGCFLGSTDFHEYFKKYLQDNQISVEPKIGEEQYYFYFFDRNLNGVEKLKNFEISFYNKELNFNFKFNYSDLILEKRDGYYLLIAFERAFRADWKLGYPFLKKYKFIFDIDSKLMGFFCSNQCPNNSSDEKNDNSPNSEEQNNNKIKESNISNNKLIIIISIVIISIIILITGIFIGKKLYEVRKRRANELLDLYEYKGNEQNEKIIDKES